MKTKKQIKNRLLSLVLALVLVVGLVPQKASAAEADFSALEYYGITITDVSIDCDVDGYTHEIYFDGEMSDGVDTLKITRLTEPTFEGRSSYAKFQCTITGTFCTTKEIKIEFEMGCTCAAYEYRYSEEIVDFSGGQLQLTYNRAKRDHVINSWVQDNSGWTYTHLGTCNICNTQVMGNCKGDSKATCATTGTCATCKQPYYDRNGHADSGTWTWESGSTSHIKKCKNGCGETLESENCTYSPATCLAPSICSVCGHVYANQLQHYYIYDTNDNRLYEHCTMGCTHVETATLNASNAAYTGSAITATVNYDYNWKGSKDLSVTYTAKAGSSLTNGKAVNAGQYTASVTVGGATASADFEITRKSIAGAAITFSPASATYPNDTGKPAVTVMDGSKQLTEGTDYTLSWYEDDFTNAGTYHLTVNGKGNYAGENRKNFTVDRNSLSADDFSFTPPEDLTFDGSAKSAEVKPINPGIGKVTVKYYDSADIPVSNPANAGTYKVKLDVESSANYNSATGLTKDDWTFTIQPANGSISIPENQSLTYDGEPVDYNDLNPGITTDGELSVKWYDSEGNPISAPTNVGTYQIGISAAAGNNYNAVEEVKQNFTIAQKELTVTALPQSITYGDKIKTDNTQVTVGTLAEGDSFTGITLTPSTANVPGGTIAPSDAVIKAGEEDVTSNYNIGYKTDVLTINPIEINVAVDAIADQTYTGNFITPAVTITDGEGKLVGEDKLVEGKDYTVEYSENNTDVGEVTVTINDVAGGNYTVSGSGTFWIVQADNSWTTEPSISGWTYGEEASTPNKGEAKFGEVAVTYSGTANDGTVYTDSTTAPDKAGKYTATFTVAGTDNYTELTKDIPFEISKALPALGTVTASIPANSTDINEITFSWANDAMAGSMTANDGQELAWGTNGINWTFTPTDTDNYTLLNDIAPVTVTDTVAPTGTVSIEENSWKDLWNTLTFGLFYKETKTVKVVPADALSGIAKVEYYDSAELLSEEQVKAITAWTDMGEDYAQDVTAEDAKTFIYYIRMTDNAGNVTYISTADATYDLTLPAISGITNGNTYYTTQKVTVTDTNLETVTLNGKTVTGEITLAGNVDQTYTVVATDKAGNETTYTVTMKPIASISAPIDEITEKNVNSGNAETISDVEAAAAAVDTANATEEEKAAIQAVTDQCDALQEVIADTAAEHEGLSDAVDSYAPDTVKSTDKDEIEQLVEELDDLLETDNLTDEERTALKDEKTKCENLIAKIEGTAALADKLAEDVDDYDEDTVTSTDKAALEQVIKDAQTLIDSGNVTEAEKEALVQTQKDAEALIDVIDDTAAEKKDLTDQTAAFDEEIVKSTDKAALEELVQDIEDLLDTDNLTTDERKVLEDAKADAETMIERIEAAQDASDTENTGKVEKVTTENVKPEDKETLEDAKADLEKALEDNAGNYTEQEKKAIEGEIARIEEALQVVENVDAVEEIIGNLPKTVELDDDDALAAIEEAKKAYEDLSDYEKSLIDEDTKEKLDQLTDAVVAYDIIKGDGSKWTKGSGKGLSFTANGSFSKFIGIEIDGKEVAKKNYDAKSGSTIITLKNSYLETLSAGKHTITVLYTDGETDGTFTISAKADSAATGDQSNILLWSTTLFGSVLALALIVAIRKKTAYKGK